MKKSVYFSLILLVILSISLGSCKGQGSKTSITTVSDTLNSSNMSKRNALINTLFPELKAQTLAKQAIAFPKDVEGEITILCIVFERNAQSLVDTWTSPILEKYPNNNVNYYEIPMIKGAWGIVSGFIDNGMRGGVPKELHNNVATYYGSLAQYKKDLMMDDKDSCYIFLLDKKGIIQFVLENAANADKLAALYAAIDKLNML